MRFVNYCSQAMNKQWTNKNIFIFPTLSIRIVRLRRILKANIAIRIENGIEWKKRIEYCRKWKHYTEYELMGRVQGNVRWHKMCPHENRSFSACSFRSFGCCRSFGEVSATKALANAWLTSVQGLTDDGWRQRWRLRWRLRWRQRWRKRWRQKKGRDEDWGGRIGAEIEWIGWKRKKALEAEEIFRIFLIWKILRQTPPPWYSVSILCLGIFIKMNKHV